jgi:uncharacterized membrane protein YbhN (UPF0104 family)
MLGSRALVRPLPLLEATLWSALAWSGYFATLWQISAGIHLGLSRTILTAAASLAALGSLLPITVSGLGVREVVFARVLSLEGATVERAVALSLTNFSVMVVSVLGLGLAGLLWRQRQTATGGKARSPR